MYIEGNFKMLDFAIISVFSWQMIYNEGWKKQDLYR